MSKIRRKRREENTEERKRYSLEGEFVVNQFDDETCEQIGQGIK